MNANNTVTRTGKKRICTQIAPMVSLHLRYIHQDLGLTGKELCKRYKCYSKSSIFRNMVKPIDGFSEDQRYGQAAMRVAA